MAIDITEFETIRVEYTATASQTDFTWPYRLLDETHLKVFVDENPTPISHSVSTTLPADTSATVVVAAQTVGAKVTIQGDIPIARTVQFPTTGAFPIDTLNSQLNELFAILQEFDGNIERCLKIPSYLNTDFNGDLLLVGTPAEGYGITWDDTNKRFQFTSYDLASLSTDVAAAAASASAAAASASAAAASAATASAAAAGAGTLAYQFTYDSSTSMADPGIGDIRFDNATLASITNIAISNATAATGNPDISDFIATWDDSTNTANRGTLIIRKDGDQSVFIALSISGGITDNGTWLQIPVTHLDSNGTISASDDLLITFTRTGDAGATGAGSGDLLSANNLSDVSNAATARTNLGLGIGVNVQAYDANTAKTNVVQSYTKQQNFGAVALTSGTSIAWNLNDAQSAKLSLAHNATLSAPTNMVDGGTYILKVTNTGTFTLAYNAVFKFAGGTAPTLTTNGTDIFSCVSDGTNLYCSVIQDVK